MARIRTIKPEFFTSEDIVELSPLARIFYISLWCEADREGRLKWKPKTLKMRYLPADDCDIMKLANELIDAGLLVIYGNDNKYAEIPSFKKHQVINNREKSSDIPENQSTKTTRDDALKTRESGVSGEGKGKEGKGKEGKGKEGKGIISASPQEDDFKFFGNVIRLNEKDYNKWKDIYQKLVYLDEFEMELRKADAYYSDNPPKNDKWFFPVSSWLERAEKACDARWWEKKRNDPYAGAL